MQFFALQSSVITSQTEVESLRRLPRPRSTVQFSPRLEALLNEYYNRTDDLLNEMEEEEEENEVEKEKEDQEDQEDQDCPFKDTKLYRSVYIYQHPDKGPKSMRANPESSQIYEEWPWIPIQEASKEGEWGHYAMGSQMDQYTLEIIVNEIFTHPDSCLQTDDPEKATLFYVPFFNSVHFHNGKLFAQDYATTKYAQAMMDAMEYNYQTWEEVFGITSKYWKQHNGADHVSIMTEPLHGFSHPRNKRGHYHYIHSQYQLRNHIVISLEVSTAFVKQYPNCAKKNIVVPYPNPDGRYSNGFYDEEVQELLRKEYPSEDNDNDIWKKENSEEKYRLQYQLFQKHASPHPSEPSSSQQSPLVPPRPFTMYYSGGNHGTCSYMRKSLAKDFQCSPSGKHQQILSSQNKPKFSFAHGMRMSTFCPCPGGDSPSAKRMYDAILAGCIPVILSQDFVWANSLEYDEEHMVQEQPMVVDPESFSLRLDSNQFKESFLSDSCEIVNKDQPPLHTYLEENITSEQLISLRQHLEHAKYIYNFYPLSEDLPINTIKHGIFPTGGAAHALVHALGERAGGARWPACEAELESVGKNPIEPNKFVC